MKVNSYAKINLALDVVSNPRSKNGYHHLRTIFQQIQLHDVITFKKRKDQGIKFTCNNSAVPLTNKNSIIKALLLLQKEARLQKKTHYLCGLDIYLQKNIPLASGLGGASSNGAGALKAVNQLWKLNFSLRKLKTIAAKIGMDVPFFLYGGTALGTHYGEKIKPLPPLKNKALLIFCNTPDSKKSTKQMYRELRSFPTNQNRQKTMQLLTKISTPKKNLRQRQPLVSLFHNDFDVLYQKNLALLKKNLQPFRATKISISGSGPFMYGFFSSTENIKKAYTFFKKCGQYVCKTQTIF